MTEYFNPGNKGYKKFGMNPGVATRDFVFAGGMAFDFDTMGRQAAAKTIADETRICLAEVTEILELAGCTLKDVVKATCYLSDDSYRQEFWATYKEVFGDGPYPARTTLVVGIAGDCRVEVDVLARRTKA